MSKYNLNLGMAAEEAAAELLKKNGYRIISRNYKTKIGEIDIIARDKDTLAFVEVKARSSLAFGNPAEAVIKHKIRQISKAALSFLKENNLLHEKARFDVVSFVYGSDEIVKAELIKNAFDLDESFVY